MQDGQTPSGDEQRAALSTAAINDLPDSAFAYIEAGGKKDSEGKTTPRSLRHYPVHDKAHADNALARANAAAAGDDADAKAIAEKALPKIKAAVKKFGAQSNSADPASDERDAPTSEEADQFADPDNKTALYKAIVAQGKDGQYESKSANFATAKRAFSSLLEQPPAHTGAFEVRMGDDDDSHTARFVGYASTTGVPYSVRDWLGEYNETILPGAFAKTLREQGNVPLLFNHDGIPLASTGSGTSRLAEDKVGLRNEADFDRRDALTNSICIQLQRRVLDKMSFSFRAIKDAWNDEYDDRGVSEAALYDSSIVTYPANPTTTAELQESMRSALGREGRSLWLAEQELSIRSTLPMLAEHRELDSDSEDLLERALRALVAADEVLCRSHGPHGRARTFHVASAMLELRAGKALSSKNEALLKTALDALSAADKQHAKAAKNHAAASDAVGTVLGNDASGDGLDSNQGAGNGNPSAPQDGAGPRSARALQLKREREAELRALRRR